MKVGGDISRKRSNVKGGGGPELDDVPITIRSRGTRGHTHHEDGNDPAKNPTIGIGRPIHQSHPALSNLS